MCRGVRNQRTDETYQRRSQQVSRLGCYQSWCEEVCVHFGCRFWIAIFCVARILRREENGGGDNSFEVPLLWCDSEAGVHLWYSKGCGDWHTSRCHWITVGENYEAGQICLANSGCGRFVCASGECGYSCKSCGASCGWSCPSGCDGCVGNYEAWRPLAQWLSKHIWWKWNANQMWFGYFQRRFRRGLVMWHIFRHGKCSRERVLICSHQLRCWDMWIIRQSNLLIISENLSCHFHINCLADVWTHQFYQVYILLIAFWLWDPCLCLYFQRGLIMWHIFGHGKCFQEKFVICSHQLRCWDWWIICQSNSLIINKNLPCDLHINCLADVWTHQFYQVYILLIAYLGQFHWAIFWSFIHDISCWLGHLVWERPCCSALDFWWQVTSSNVSVKCPWDKFSKAHV